MLIRAIALIRRLACLAFAGVFCLAAQEAQPEIVKRTDYAQAIATSRAILQQEIARTSTPGLAIAIVDRDQVVWAEGFGSSGSVLPFTPGTLSSMQSISKHYTALAFLRLAERGLISLDDPITKCVPEFTVRSRTPVDYNAITFRRLLSHWAGFQHEAPIGNNMDPYSPSFDAHIRSISDTWLRFPPGDRFAYSNLGVDLAGYALQRLTGKPFPQVVREEVFEPLGMRSSTFDDVAAVSSPSFATGHWGSAPAAHTPIPIVPSGGMYSTVLDMAKCISMHLANGVIGGPANSRRAFRQTTFLHPETLAEMYRPQFQPDGQVVGYGLGTGRLLGRGAPIVFHSGGGFGYVSMQLWIPEYGLGVAVLANTNNFDTGNTPVLALQEFVRTKLGTLPPWDSVAAGLPVVDVPASQLQALTGTYKGRAGVLTFSLSGAHLQLSSEVYGYQTLNAHSPLVFSEMREHPNMWTFHVDASGRGVSVTVLGDETYVLNDRAGDPKGPNSSDWSGIPGRYGVQAPWGPWEWQVDRHNGYLYTYNNGAPVKLTEFQSHVFSEPDGIVWEFNGHDAVIEGVQCTRR
ncbi:MAG TPA: serine hydrolase domain-containing protein [Bryobacteraceae bacterium]|nr:serine hydrolase domain-containing protein [Bryobacteraceae bacterium]